MKITLKQLKARIKKNGLDYYRYIGRVSSDDGLHSYAIVDDCYKQETLHIEEEDDIISSICGECEN